MSTSLRHALALSLLAVAIHASAGAELGKNLIKDPGAESAVGSPDGSEVPIPHWVQKGGLTAVLYGALGFPSQEDPGPPHRGLNFFAGGGKRHTSASQSIDVTALAADIDTGTVSYALSAYLGGWGSQKDNARLEVDFDDAQGVLLGSTTLGPVTPKERKNITGLLKRSGTGAVPIGTRSILVTMRMSAPAGGYNDGYADALSLVLRSADVVEDDAGREASEDAASGMHGGE
jgi:hypothetical protein